MSAADRRRGFDARKSEGSAERSQKWLILVSGGFLIYESVLIVGFGDYFYGGVSSELGRWAMIGAAAFGYFLLGALSRSPGSILACVLPVLVAWVVDSPVPPDAWGDENLPLYQMWILLIYIFVPAWLIGLFGSRLVNARREGNLRR